MAFGAKVDTRAAQLGANVQRILSETRAPKVNIIAHSMGGLDARHLLFNDRDHGRIHERIASLSTISTPHEGSPFADWGLRQFPNLTTTLKKLLVDVEGLHDLRTDACRTFNERVEVQAFEAECESTIRFQTYAGRQSRPGIVLPLRPAFDIIQDAEGDNDGLVSVRSARWRDRYFKGFLENADHLNELAHWDANQILSGETPNTLRSRVHGFYAAIAAELP